MNLDVFRRAVIAESGDRAERSRRKAEQEADRRLSEARDRAREMVDRAKAEGEEVAAGEMARSVATARREARRRVLDAQREAYDELRHRVIDEARRRWDRVDRADRLEALARRRLGADAEIEPTPDVGGFVARIPGRQLDYRVPALVDAVIEEMGPQVEALWR